MRVAITVGEPAGIGPDIILKALAYQPADVEWVVVGCPHVLKARAEQLGLSYPFITFDKASVALGRASILPVHCPHPVFPGQLNPRCAAYVLTTLETAADLCLAGIVQAMVTAPVHKGVINDAGIEFTGHTEFLAHYTKTQHVVMMLACNALRVALATTHIPLKDVAATLSIEKLVRSFHIVNQALAQQFAIEKPRIVVCGLNPHAGENGHLGREELDIIGPAIKKAQAAGLCLQGPLPADTAFVPSIRAETDAYVAMFHDQGLPVLKALGFGDAVNITLGLPIVRLSVDHGVALTLAGTGNAKADSLLAALAMACSMKQR